MSASAGTLSRGGSGWGKLLLVAMLALAVPVILGAPAMTGSLTAPAAPARSASTTDDDFRQEMESVHQRDAVDKGAVPKELPPFGGLNAHAREKHPEAERIVERYEKNDFWCLEVWVSPDANRIMYRFTYHDTSLQGMIIMRYSGDCRTVMMLTPARIEQTIIDYSYVPRTEGFRFGPCAKLAT